MFQLHNVPALKFFVSWCYLNLIKKQGLFKFLVLIDISFSFEIQIVYLFKKSVMTAYFSVVHRISLKSASVY